MPSAEKAKAKLLAADRLEKQNLRGFKVKDVLDDGHTVLIETDTGRWTAKLGKTWNLDEFRVGTVID